LIEKPTMFLAIFTAMRILGLLVRVHSSIVIGQCAPTNSLICFEAFSLLG